MAELFSALDGISPWWWTAVALAVAAIELLTGTYFLLWLALAALSVSPILWLVPGLSGIAQIVIFSILLLIYTATGWRVADQSGKARESNALNNRAAALIGRRAVVAGQFSGGTGAVEIDGIRWRGKLRKPDAESSDESLESAESDIELGSELTIVGADGMTLLLEKS